VGDAGQFVADLAVYLADAGPPAPGRRPFQRRVVGVTEKTCGDQLPAWRLPVADVARALLHLLYHLSGRAGLFTHCLRVAVGARRDRRGGFVPVHAQVAATLFIARVAGGEYRAGRLALV